MSADLYGFARQFATSQMSAAEFTDEFIKRWKEERDSGNLTEDSAEMSEQLSSIFCLADLYNPDPKREEYELDEFHLRDKVNAMLRL